MLNSLLSCIGFTKIKPRYAVVKWHLGDLWSCKDRWKGKFKSFNSDILWDEDEDHFYTYCTTNNKDEAIELCEYLNNNGTLWEEEK